MSTSEAPIRPFKNQDYYELKNSHDENNLFEDHEFPATSRSLYYTKNPPQGITWLRPKDARKNPKFSNDGFDRNDMDQGNLGNCWFIAASVGIMQNEKLFDKVVPKDQSFDENYAGIFHFRFWLYGEWVDVVVDDRLPYWPDGRLVFCSNRQDPSEYWGSLLEKAYAKLYGSYENLEGGQTFDALIDMSGGIQEQFDLNKMQQQEKLKLWSTFDKSFRKHAILGCSIDVDPHVKEARLPNGLVKGHAYTITKIGVINGHRLIRIRNPWGNEVEWKGAWSDSSKEWNTVSEEEKIENGVTVSGDGEFWMSFEEFLINWDQVQICHLSGDSYSDELSETDNDADLAWQCTTHQSAWVEGSTAGGCGQQNAAKFWTNPQFLVQLADVDSDDGENKADLIIALMQKDSRLKRMKKGGESAEEFIQFRVFKIKDGVEVIPGSSTKFYSSQLEKIASSGSYINLREVTKSLRVDPGNYLIIPSTYEEDHTCEFMLRIFTEHQIELGKLDEDKPAEDLTDDDVFIDNSGGDNSIKKWFNFLGPILFTGKRKEGAALPISLGPHFDAFVQNGGIEMVLGAAKSIFGNKGNKSGGGFFSGGGSSSGGSGGGGGGGLFGGKHSALLSQALDIGQQIASSGGQNNNFSRGMGFLNSFIQPSNNGYQPEQSNMSRQYQSYEPQEHYNQEYQEYLENQEHEENEEYEEEQPEEEAGEEAEEEGYAEEYEEPGEEYEQENQEEYE